MSQQATLSYERKIYRNDPDDETSEWRFSVIVKSVNDRTGKTEIVNSYDFPTRSFADRGSAAKAADLQIGAFAVQPQELHTPSNTSL